MLRSRKILFLIWVSVVWWVGVTSARAAGSKSIALYIEGADAAAYAAEIRGVLPPELGVIDEKEFATQLRKAGQQLPIGNPIGAKGVLRDKILARVGKAAEVSGADAVIVGRVRIGKAGLELWLVWRSADGSLAVDEAVSLRGDANARRSGFKTALDAPAQALVPKVQPQLGSGGSGASAHEGGEGGEGGAGGNEGGSAGGDQGGASGDERATHVWGTSVVAATVAFEAGGRNFSLSDPVSKNLRPYEVWGAPMIAAQIEAYPAAIKSIPFLKDLGLTFRFAMALGLSSATSDGTTVSSSWLRMRGGLKYRLRPGSDTGPVLAALGEVGVDSFGFENAGDLADEVPAVGYFFVRGGLQLRVPIGPAAFELTGGYRGLLDVGELGSRFQGTSAFGLDGGVGLFVTLPAGFEVHLSGDYARYVYAFAPIPGDAYVAGGAVDEMLGARLGISYIY